MTYRVVRSYGRYGRDYLSAWDARWGTVCIGAKRLAMTFASEDEAKAARSRAACFLMSSVCGSTFTWSIEASAS